jgi:hypothetical protein
MDRVIKLLETAARADSADILLPLIQLTWRLDVERNWSFGLAI